VEHTAVDPAKLIPIGAGPEALRPQILDAIETHPSPVLSVPITTFDDQAAAFERLAAPLLEK
jgi:predicted NBD/HSP70 family sugar kinase